VDQVLMLLTES